MLLRHLHRPPLRSVTAAWQPATTIPALFHHGHIRASSNINGDDPQHEDQQHGDQQQAPPSPAPPSPEPPLIEQLFPDDFRKSMAKLRRASDIDAPETLWVPPPFEEEQSHLAMLESLQDGLQDGNILPGTSDSPSAFRPQAVLIISAASKNLLESDFLRLGAKGKHLDGWVGGILKVIQARNPDTLEPQGHYFVLFNTNEAAAVYKDRVEHLWKLGKTYIPRAHHSFSHMIQSPLPVGLRRTNEGEDVAKLIRSFTLIPPSQRYYVQISRMSPSKIVELYHEDGLVNQLFARAGSRFLVLIRVEGGRLTLDTLRRVIEDDGVQRNLPWRITDLANGILPFGKAFVKGNDKAFADIAPNVPAGNKSAQGSEGGAVGTLRMRTSGEPPGSRAVLPDNANVSDVKQYPRFIIPFMDKAEAYRFVRNWHRRELRVKMGGGAEDEPQWEEAKVINATILW
ncbi:hypothetical protein F4861DRAFT_488697 [Xylaria intraflava]|nr:hypothetical protein F4861DRAFT_488697 [Xylaria intraflava]